MRKFFFSIGILLFIGGILVTFIGFFNSDLSNIWDNLPNTNYTRKITGDGNIIDKSETYESEEIEIYLPTNNGTLIYFDESLETIEIKTDKNIMDEITVIRDNGKITLKFIDGNTLGKPTDGLKVYLPDVTQKVVLKGIICFPSLSTTFKNNKNIEIKGATEGVLNCGEIDSLKIDSMGAIADFTVKGNFKKLELINKGATDIDFEGTADELFINNSGAGNISAFDLKAKRATVFLSGAADIDIFASEYLKIDLSGVGDIVYKGNPSTTEFNKRGIGSITKA